ncbi:uncharacterized protein DNG_05711 [Cephalotrichum gorgonifer]|uniref:MAPEG domain-containing protein n=1 Tax=Cephalotrichum gorgonifer TaxID=2041049 RepID=A0AAE8SVQ4_9PEZI|nr:uncharacterized protein DNG_05711 [Cephalotrichum gorgonifer]
MDFLPSSNISLYTVPAAFILALIPGAYGSFLAVDKVDLAYPRTFVPKITNDDSVTKETKLAILRAKATSENAWETLGFYASAVVAANVARVDTALLNGLTLTYIASRIAYSYAYIVLGRNRKFVPVRSGVWALGVAATLWLYVAAGKALA